MNSKQARTLDAIFESPLNGNIEWAKIESLLIGLGAQVVEGPGSSVSFSLGGRCMSVHRPHPGKEALRYRVKLVREFVQHLKLRPQ